MYRNMFGDLIMTSPASREAAQYYNLSENLQERLEEAEGNSFSNYIENKKLKEENDKLVKKLSDAKIEHYKRVLQNFIKTNCLNNNEHIQYCSPLDTTYYVIQRDKFGKYWLYSYELRRYICETECGQEDYKLNKNKNDYSLSDLKNSIKGMIEFNILDIKELDANDDLTPHRKICYEYENEVLKRVLKMIDKVNCI